MAFGCGKSWWSLPHFLSTPSNEDIRFIKDTTNKKKYVLKCGMDRENGTRWWGQDRGSEGSSGPLGGIMRSRWHEAKWFWHLTSVMISDGNVSKTCTFLQFSWIYCFSSKTFPLSTLANHTGHSPEWGHQAEGLFMWVRSWITLNLSLEAHSKHTVTLTISTPPQENKYCLQV